MFCILNHSFSYIYYIMIRYIILKHAHEETCFWILCTKPVIQSTELR
jgi:hypothetical protein